VEYLGKVDAAVADRVLEAPFAARFPFFCRAVTF